MVKALFVTQRCPYPEPINSKFRVQAYRENSIIEALLSDFQVELLCFRHRKGESFPNKDLAPRSMSISQIYPETPTLLERAASNLLGGWNHSYDFPFSDDFVEAMNVRAPHQLLWISGPSMIPYLGPAIKMGYTPILDLHHFHFSHPVYSSSSHSKRHGIWDTLNPSEAFSRVMADIGHWNFFQKQEMSKLGAIVVAHPQEKMTLLEFLPPHAANVPIHVIPDCVEPSSYLTLHGQEGGNILFVLPQCFDPQDRLNISKPSWTWLAKEILPRLIPNLMASSSQTRVQVLGPSEFSKSKLFKEFESTIDWVSDRGLTSDALLEPLRNSKIIVFPTQNPASRLLPTATEVREFPDIRILQALAAGRAVVCTHQAIEGFQLTPSFDTWVSDHPDGLTSSILKLLHSTELRMGTAKNALTSIYQSHHTAIARSQLYALLNQLDLSKSPA